MPVYKHPKRPGVWRIVVSTHGKRRESTYRGTKAEAEAEEARLRLREERPTDLRRAPSLRDFCAAIYSPHAKLHLRKSTWETVRIYQISNLCALLGDLRLNDITAPEVERYKQTRGTITLDKRKTKVGASTINNELRVLGTILRFAREQGYPCAEPKWKRLPPAAKPRVALWSAAQVTRLYLAAREHAPEVEPLIVFLANTGCRKGEAIACEWDWIDEQRDLICIPSNEVWRPKNGLPREVPLSKTLRALLKAQRGKHERWVFPTSHAGRYASFPKDLYWRARDEAGLAGGVHTLRHTYASHFLAKVPDMFLLAKVLGHAHERVTAIYSHLLPGHLDRAREAVDLAPPKVKTVGRAVGKSSKTARSAPEPRSRH